MYSSYGWFVLSIICWENWKLFANKAMLNRSWKVRQSLYRENLICQILGISASNWSQFSSVCLRNILSFQKTTTMRKNTIKLNYMEIPFFSSTEWRWIDKTMKYLAVVMIIISINYGEFDNNGRVFSKRL